MTSPAGLSTTPDALRLAGTLLRLVRTLDQQLRASGGPEALALTDLSVLGQIDHGIDLPSQVARTLRLDPARVTHITDRLAAQGYIERALDPADRRCWRLRVTETGRRRLGEGRDRLRAEMERLLDGLSADERAGLVRGLEAVRHDLDGAPGVPDAPSLSGAK